MERITKVLILLLLSSLGIVGTAFAQIPANVTNFRFSSPNVAFDGTEGTTAAEQQNGYITKIHLNGGAPRIVSVTCTGSFKPWVCQIADVTFEIGSNILYVTIQRNTPCTPPAGATPDYCSESGFSNPLVVFHAVSQREIITNTNNQTITTIKCVPGSYLVTRITNAAVLQATANSQTKTISNILATSNAIYIFACDLAP